MRGEKGGKRWRVRTEQWRSGAAERQFCGRAVIILMDKSSIYKNMEKGSTVSDA